MGRRWDTDVRLTGMGDGAEMAPGIAALLEAATRPEWVAEDPEVHLLPHLRRVAGAPGSAWQLGAARLRDATYVVDLVWTGPKPALRAAVYALVGAVAEASTSIVESRGADGLATFDVVTGSVTAGEFAPHGHLLRLRVAVGSEHLPGPTG
jgi:hypothetical protein